jgi:hypothetical protein
VLVVGLTFNKSCPGSGWQPGSSGTQAVQYCVPQWNLSGSSGKSNPEEDKHFVNSFIIDIMADPATASNSVDVSVPSFHLLLAVDFASKQLFGQAQITVTPRTSTTLPPWIFLDIHHLDVISITAAKNCDVGQCGQHVLSFEKVPFTSFGSQLRIDMAPLATLNTACICINYVAGAGAALCWLTPEQTAGKEHPFLFTQGQACLNRTLFPCQDTPSSRSTWTATLVVPRRFTAVMSAPTTSAVVGDRGIGAELSEDSAEIVLLRRIAQDAASRNGAIAALLSAKDVHAYSAAMPHPVPVYLVALAVGDLRCAGELHCTCSCRSHTGCTRELFEPVSPPAFLQMSAQGLACGLSPCRCVRGVACTGMRSVDVSYFPLVPQLARAAWEFGHANVTESYVAAGERLFGPYRWGRYDMCIMPPSFPYGG